MAEFKMPPKVAFDADTDQSLAWTREHRERLTSGPRGEFVRRMSEIMAAQIRAEFPEANAGRLVTAVADQMNALDAEMEERHGGSDFDLLVSITALAGEQLDREAREGGDRG